MSRAIVTLAVGRKHERLLTIALPSFQAFAGRHRYELIVAEPMDHGRPGSWLKIPALQQALTAHEEVLWLDADVVIIDPTEDLNVPAGAWQALVEHHTDDGRVPNAGVWLLRPVMLPILERMWDMTGYLHHGWWEQAALIELMGYTGRPVTLTTPTELHARTHFLDPGWNVHRNDRRPVGRGRVMHATMHPNREQTMRGWAQRLPSSPPEVALPQL